jgi:hypothetical protein
MLLSYSAVSCRRFSMRAPFCLALLIFFSFDVALAQHHRVHERLRVGKDIRVFHAEKAELHGGSVPIAGPKDTEGHDPEFVEGLSGQPHHTLIIKRSYGLKNGVAGIGLRDNKRYIVWDPEWHSGSGFSWYVLAHEIGHHVCRHTIESTKLSSHEIELEADRFAGHAMSLSDGVRKPTKENKERDSVVQKMRETLSKEGSPSHPPADKRIAAFLEGYWKGSSCNGPL